MQLDGCLGGAKRCPRKHRQAQIDGGGVEGIDGLFEIDPKGLFGIQPSGDANQSLRKVCVDAPIAHSIGIGQCVAGHGSANTQMVELGVLCPKTGFDVAQAFAKRQLRKGHAQKLIETGKRFDLVLAPVARDTSPKRREWQMLRQLCENQLAPVHGMSPRGCSSQRGRIFHHGSNRDQKMQSLNQCPSIPYGV